MTIDRPLETLMVIWGVPGTGKSTFARWLVKAHGYVHAETDAGADAQQAVVQAQRGRSVVIEYGMFVDPSTINEVRIWQSLGAKPWWFDGNRLAAYSAWRNENQRAGRNFRDEKWDEVVDPINQNWGLIEQLFGRDRILHTIERGPTYVPPEEIYGRMLRVMGSSQP